MSANEWANEHTWTNTQKTNHRINPAFPTFTGKKNHKKKLLISVCSCVGWTVQALSRHRLTHGVAGRTSTRHVRTRVRERPARTPDSSVPVRQQRWCRDFWTHDAWGIWKHQSSVTEPPAARGTGRGILTATADEGFPTPSSSGREASGAE